MEVSNNKLICLPTGECQNLLSIVKQIYTNKKKTQNNPLYSL